jgi:8-oxo-dGTP pyrophosphatase MutT (NUDIX family)
MTASIPRRLRGAGLWVIDEHILMTSTLGHDRWAVVGGGVEPGESAYQACVREFREEVGIDVHCERLAILGDIIIRPNDRIEQDVCFYFIVTAVPNVSGIPTVSSQEPGLEFAWIPLAELGRVDLVPPSLDSLIPRAVASDAPLYVTYDCRTDPDERGGTRIWT